MALKEQANKKKSPRNRDDNRRDGKPLERQILQEDEPLFDTDTLFNTDKTE